MLMRREKSLNDFKIGTFMAHFLSVRFDRSPSACLWGGRRKALTISKLAHLWVVVRVTAGQAWQRKGYRLTVKYSKHFKTKSLDVFISICWALSERLVAFEDHWTLKTTEPWGPLNHEDHSSQPLHITHQGNQSDQGPPAFQTAVSESTSLLCSM